MTVQASPKRAFGGETKTAVVSFSALGERTASAALTNPDFQRQISQSIHHPVGPRDHTTWPHVVTFEQLAPVDSEALDLAIHAAYRHVFGNCYVMAQDRAVELEAQLKDGRLCMRDFVRGLAQTEFYRSRFFASVSPHRGIELSFKHLLGRSPLSQQEVAACLALQAQAGYDALVNHLVDSPEYREVFGDHTVPYTRGFSSAAGMPMMNFVRTAALESSFVSSDRVVGASSVLLDNLAAGQPMVIRRPASSRFRSMASSWAAGKPPANAEKLWRGLALVGAVHLAGMLVNVSAQILGIHELDRLPAMFLGL